jgi:hypothetical protein
MGFSYKLQVMVFKCGLVKLDENFVHGLSIFPPFFLVNGGDRRSGHQIRRATPVSTDPPSALGIPLLARKLRRFREILPPTALDSFHFNNLWVILYLHIVKNRNCL